MYKYGYICNLQSVTTLVEAGANIDWQSAKGLTPLMLTCQTNCKEYSDCFIKYLISKGANLNLQTVDGWTAVMYAIKFDVLDSLELLINAKADLNIQNNDGDTALMLACRKNSALIVKKLIDAGANMYIKNNNEQNSLIIASMKNNQPVIETLFQCNFGKVPHGEHIHQHDVNKKTALMYILEHCLNENTANNAEKFNEMCQCYDCLFSPYKKGTKKIETNESAIDALSLIKKFINVGVDVNTIYGNMTPLIYAVKKSSIDMVSFLLTQDNINVHLKNPAGQTAHDISIQKYGEKHPISRLLTCYF
jgi:ankyrin repeat protein